VTFWKRALQVLGLRKDDDWIYASGEHLVFRDVGKAKALPQEPPQAGPKHRGICEQCSGPLRKVVFTTAGAGAQAEVWREYPLAVDGWVCSACGWAAAPRCISPEESIEYGRRGAEHATAGEFDDAEFWFRRIIASWPGYHAGYADLGQLMSVRAEAASDRDAREHYRSEALRWFERAVEADPECSLPGVRLPYARILAVTGGDAKATKLLESIAGMSEAPEALLAEANALLASIQDGDALFSRATETMGETLFEPPQVGMSAGALSAMERGRGLLAEAARRKADFPTLFMLGKAEQRLQNWEAARAAFHAAHELDPDQVDGCRELCHVYLELGLGDRALPLARRAVELRPDDSGLQCNLAVALLLAGDIDAARATSSAALTRDPSDAVCQLVRQVIDDVDAGLRPRPRTLAQLEGRE